MNDVTTDTSTALVPLADVENMVGEVVDRVLYERALPSLLRPHQRRELPSHGIDDPALIGFPPTLPLELALGDSPRNEVLRAYDINANRWEVLRHNPTFQKALKDALEMLQRQGMSFRVKAALQAEALLETSWKLIHSASTPAPVKADLIKTTYRVAGLEPKETANVGSPLQININLG